MENITIESISTSIKSGKIRISDHADEEAHNDNLLYEEIFYSVLNGEIIESYPKNKPYPSCLILGFNFINEPIHSVWAYNKATESSVLITVYRPDSKKWILWKKRKTIN